MQQALFYLISDKIPIFSVTSSWIFNKYRKQLSQIWGETEENNDRQIILLEC